MRNDRGLTKGGEWVYGGPLKLLDNSVIIVAEAARTTETHPHYPSVSLGKYSTVIPETVGQSIGLMALKGDKEIYTDDIISFNVSKGFGTDIRFVGKVYFCTSRLAYCVDALPAWDMQIAHNLSLIEVIGNIHQPELLDKQVRKAVQRKSHKR